MENKKENKKDKNVNEEELTLTKEEEEQLKKKLEELRKRDPFIYRQAMELTILISFMVIITILLTWKSNR